MRKLLALFLVLVLILMSCTALADDRTTFWIPENLFDVEIEELPTDTFPVVRTKTADGVISVAVIGETDKLYANWMGYGEEKEEVILDHGVGTVSQDGHKYQLGASYVNYSWKDWIDSYSYHWDGKTLEDAEHYFEEKYADAIAAGARIQDEPFKGYYVFYTYDRYYFTEKGGQTEYHQIGDYEFKKIGDYFQSYEEAEKAAKELGGMSYTEEESAEYKTTVYTSTGYGVTEDGGYAWLYTTQNAISHGWPNRAYTLLTGEYAIDYTRAGVPVYATRTTEGKDFFETGIEGAKSYVNWEIGKKKNRVLSYKTEYPEGSDIASIYVSFPTNGRFYHYTITYRAGEDKTYVAIYSAKDELIKARYKVGDQVIAQNSSAVKWINCETHREEHDLEPLRGELLGHPAHITSR